MQFLEWKDSTLLNPDGQPPYVPQKRLQRKVKVAAVVEPKPVLGRWSTKSQPMRILESTLGEG